MPCRFGDFKNNGSFMGLLKWCRTAVFTLIILLFVIPGCQNLTPRFNPDTAVAPTYSSISASILVPACVGCHSGSGEYSYDSYTNTLKSLVKGNPASSALYMAVKNGSMPVGNRALSSPEVKAIYDWIADSARNN